MRKTLLILIFLLVLSGCSNLVSGKVECSGNAIDTDLSIECDAPILVRKVEMVQYYESTSGDVKIGFVNYPVESFEENPKFPEDICNKVFHGSIKIDGKELSEDQINSLVYNNEEDLVPYKELGIDNGNKYNLVLLDDVYVTASDEWQLGEIRVSYYTMNIDSQKEYTVIQ